MVAGIHDPEVAAGTASPCRPHALQAHGGGPLALTATTTVADIQALAMREGLTIRTDVVDYAAGARARERLQPLLPAAASLSRQRRGATR
jgi:hypothetical protein